MKIWYNHILEPTSPKCFDVNASKVRIGSSPNNDIVLESPYVSSNAVVLRKIDSKWELFSLGLDSVTLGDSSVNGGSRCSLNGVQVLRIYPFTLTIDVPADKHNSDQVVRDNLDHQLSDLIRRIHVKLLPTLQGKIVKDADSITRDILLQLERNLDEFARLEGLMKGDAQSLLSHTAGVGVRNSIVSSIVNRSSKARATNPIWSEDRHWSEIASAVPDREQELDHLQLYLHKRLQTARCDSMSEQMDVIESSYWNEWREAAGRLSVDVKAYLALRHLKKEIKDITFGYGPLEDLLRTPIISEIMVVDSNHIFVERNGTLENSGRRFISDDVTVAIIERIVSRVGRRIDKSQPLVDARLTDGSRVNAIIPPLAISGPCLTIRKFPDRQLLIEDLIAKGALTETVATFLRAAVLKGCNILVSGGTGTGKTTLLNCLSDFIPDRDRIVTIEDTAELQIKKEHVVRLETKQANIEGAGEYTICDLVKNALRMRPDRIIVGECRGPEALDMLQAMNTGHDGSMTTIHANTSNDVILRLEVLVQMAADLPVSSIHRQIASAIDIIIQLKRFRNGRRAVTQVTELVSVEDSGEVRTKDIFAIAGHDQNAEIQATGMLPTFMDELLENGWLELESFYV